MLESKFVSTQFSQALDSLNRLDRAGQGVSDNVSPFNLAQVYCDLSLHTALESLERLVGWVGKTGQVRSRPTP